MQELLAKLQGMGGGASGGSEPPSFNYRSPGRGNNRMPSSLEASTKKTTDPVDEFANAMLAKRKAAQEQTALNKSANSAGDDMENYGGLA